MFSRLLLKLAVLIPILFFFACSPHPLSEPSLSFNNSQLLKLSQHYKELAEHYEQLVEANPDDSRLKIKLANFYYDFRDYERVRKFLKGTDSQQAKILLAKAYAKLKDYDYAIEIFEQLKPLPEDNEYIYLYGQVLEAKNLFPQALKIYRRAGAAFDNLAKQRIEFIKTKIEKGVPASISELAAKADEFVDQLKDEAAIIFLVDEEIEINAQNTSLSTIHVLEKVLQNRGKDLAEVEVNYDSTYERVELEFARTVTKDGKVIYVGRENVRDVSRYLNFPLYSNSRAFIISMPSVEEGSFIEYKIKIYSSKLIDDDDFNFIYRLREKYPVFKANLRLIIPENREVNFKFFNQEYAEGINLKPAMTQKENKKIYTWNFNQIKPIIPEYDMPNTSYINPAVLISSFSSWEQIYKWWNSLYQDKTEVTEEINDFVEDIIKGALTDLDKIKKIYEYVAKNIRYVAIEYGDSGYEPHRAHEVFINRYGDCKDKAMLLITMLKAVGLKAYPVLIPTRTAYSIDKDFASLNFNHAICALRIDGDLIFMDSTAETVPFKSLPLSDQDRLALIFFDDSWQIANTGHVKENKVIYNMDIAINLEENATITRSVISEGFFASSYRWYLKYTHPALIKEDIQKKMMEISSLSQLLNYEIKNIDDFDFLPELKYKFITEKLLNLAGNLRIVPALDQVYLDHNLISKAARSYPIDFDGLYTKEARIRINLPDNLKIKYLPAARILENPWFKLEISYANKADYIDFYQKFIVKERFVDKGEYQEFKSYLKDALYLLREEIILERIN